MSTPSRSASTPEHNHFDSDDDAVVAPRPTGPAGVRASSAVQWDVTVLAPPGGDRWTTWDELGVAHGPQPRPSWVITSGEAFDTELGILKSGKEADVHLIERTGPDGACLLAAKRYRGADHRLFRRDDAYQAGRRHQKSRQRRAIANRSTFGRGLIAGMWAEAEWLALCRLWGSGVRVPYPVSHDGEELLMEFIDDGLGHAAPRLAQSRPGPEALAALWEQFRLVVLTLAEDGFAHGDLSPYNLLVTASNELVVIDLPQLVDVTVNPQGIEFLHRDVMNVSRWFVARGAAEGGEELFAEALARLY